MHDIYDLIDSNYPVALSNWWLTVSTFQVCAIVAFLSSHCVTVAIITGTIFFGGLSLFQVSGVVWSKALAQVVRQILKSDELYTPETRLSHTCGKVKSTHLSVMHYATLQKAPSGVLRDLYEKKIAPPRGLGFLPPDGLGRYLHTANRTR